MYNQMVTWTAFAILAMFFSNAINSKVILENVFMGK